LNHKSERKRKRKEEKSGEEKEKGKVKMHDEEKRAAPEPDTKRRRRRGPAVSIIDQTAEGASPSPSASVPGPSTSNGASNSAKEQREEREHPVQKYIAGAVLTLITPQSLDLPRVLGQSSVTTEADKNASKGKGVTVGDTTPSGKAASDGHLIDSVIEPAGVSGLTIDRLSGHAVITSLSDSEARSHPAGQSDTDMEEAHRALAPSVAIASPAQNLPTSLEKTRTEETLNSEDSLDPVPFTRTQRLGAREHQHPIDRKNTDVRKHPLGERQRHSRNQPVDPYRPLIPSPLATAPRITRAMSAPSTAAKRPLRDGLDRAEQLVEPSHHGLGLRANPPPSTSPCHRVTTTPDHPLPPVSTVHGDRVPTAPLGAWPDAHESSQDGRTRAPAPIAPLLRGKNDQATQRSEPTINAPIAPRKPTTITPSSAPHVTPLAPSLSVDAPSPRRYLSDPLNTARLAWETLYIGLRRDGLFGWIDRVAWERGALAGYTSDEVETIETLAAMRAVKELTGVSGVPHRICF
jgi:hypothetical protein